MIAEGQHEGGSSVAVDAVAESAPQPRGMIETCARSKRQKARGEQCMPHLVIAARPAFTPWQDAALLLPAPPTCARIAIGEVGPSVTASALRRAVATMAASLPRLQVGKIGAG